MTCAVAHGTCVMNRVFPSHPNEGFGVQGFSDVEGISLCSCQRKHVLSCFEGSVLLRKCGLFAIYEKPKKCSLAVQVLERLELEDGRIRRKPLVLDVTEVPSHGV